MEEAMVSARGQVPLGEMSENDENPTLDPQVREAIGKKLRHFYDSLMEADGEIPQRFRDILDRLSTASTGECRR